MSADDGSTPARRWLRLEDGDPGRPTAWVRRVAVLSAAGSALAGLSLLLPPRPPLAGPGSLVADGAAAACLAPRPASECVPFGLLQVKCYPAFMFVGINKAATTSISRYLLAHPLVRLQQGNHAPLRPFVDDGGVVQVEGSLEVDLFDGRRERYNDTDHDAMRQRSFDWTPFSWRSDEFVLGHYTPAYLAEPEVPSRIVALYPNAASCRFVVVLRRPAARFESDYWMHIRRAHEHAGGRLDKPEEEREGYLGLAAISFSNADAAAAVHLGLESLRSYVGCLTDSARSPDLAAFERLDPQTRLAFERQCASRSVTDRTANFLVHRALYRGLYAHHLSRWFALLPRDNFFVTSVERWAANGLSTYDAMLRFIGVQPTGPCGFADGQRELILEQRYKTDPRPGSFNATLAAALRDFYHAETQRLQSDHGYDLARDLGWESEVA